MPMDLEWDVIKAPVGVMCRCSSTFVHKVYRFCWNKTLYLPVAVYVTGKFHNELTERNGPK